MGAARPRVRRRRRVRVAAARALARSARRRPRDPRKLALAVLVRELGRSLRELEPALTTADDVWLRAFKSRLHDPLPPAVAADLPDWLWDRLGDAYGDDERVGARARVARAGAARPARQPAEDHARRGARGAGRGRASTRRRRRTRRSGIRVAGPAVARAPSAGSPTARLEVQDEGSQLVGYLVAPKRTDMVVDFCAGAGGKTLLLGALMRSQGRLYAFDVVRQAARQAEAAACALGTVERASAAARQRARREGQAPRRQDRPRAGRRAVHRLRHAAAQSRPQVAAAGAAVAELAREAARDPRRRRDAGEARRPARLRDVQRAAR